MSNVSAQSEEHVECFQRHNNCTATATFLILPTTPPLSRDFACNHSSYDALSMSMQ